MENYLETGFYERDQMPFSIPFNSTFSFFIDSTFIIGAADTSKYKKIQNHSMTSQGISFLYRQLIQWLDSCGFFK